MIQNYKKILQLTVFCLLHLLFIAQIASSQTDSIVSTHTVPTVRIEHNREPIRRESGAFQRMERKDFPQAIQQVAEALPYIAGVFVRNYGGLGGMKTISLRGMASAHTLVMADGLRLNQAQNGIADMSFIPASLVEGIEVGRGGTFAAYGGGGLAGSVQLRLRQPDSVAAVRLQTGIGSFGEYSGGISADIPVAKNEAIFLSARQISAQGDYPFTFSQFGKQETLRRSNADASSFSAALRYVGENNSTSWGITSLLQSGQRGAPGAVVQGNVEQAAARLREIDAAQILTYNTFLTENLAADITASGRLHSWRYSDTASPVLGRTEQQFTSFDALLRSAFRTQYSTVELSLMPEVNYIVLNGNRLSSGSGGNVERIAAALALSAEGTIAPLEQFFFRTSVRADVISDVGSAVSASAVVNSPPIADVISVYIGSTINFRPPSFNELYYQNFGSDSLMPERSQSLNTGIEFRHKNIVVGLDAFVLQTQDLIIALPISPIAWSARNISAVQARGVECSIVLDSLQGFRLRGAYSYRATIDKEETSPFYGKDVVYSPRETFSGMLQYSFKRFRSELSLQYASFSYALPSNDVSALVPSYLLLSAAVGGDIPVGASVLALDFSAENLTNNMYAVIRNFPMPGRSFRLQLHYTIAL